MRTSPTRWFAVAALLAVAADPPTKDEKPPAPQPAPAASAAPALDSFKVPDNAVLVVVEKLADALRMVPRAIVLPAGKYEELQAELKRLRGGARAENLAAPSKCQLKGKVDGGVLALQAQFVYSEPPPAVVRLGCREARANVVTLDDGRTPLLRYDSSEGFSVPVDKPGEHRLTLDLELALATRGTGRGFELDLPRAAITTLELELPAGSRELRLDGKPLGDPLLELKGNVLRGSLTGSAERLDLSWSGPAAGPGALTVSGRIQVRVEERQTVSEADLTLERRGGESDAWQVLVPPGAEVKLPPGEEGNLGSVEADDQAYGPYGSLRKLRLKAPAASVRLLVTARGPQPRPGAPAPVGPFAVPGATRQDGTLLVSSAAPGLRLDFPRRGDVARRVARPEEADNDPGLVAVFHYWGVPHVEKPSAETGPGSLSLLDIEAEAVRGQLEARVVHALQLVHDAAGSRRWRLKTRVEITPVRSGVDLLHVALPPAFRFAADAGSTDPVVRATEVDPKANVLTFRLSVAEAKAFTLNVEGDYAVPAPDSGKAALFLPRPLGTRDLGGQVTLSVPDDLELLPAEGSNPTLELTGQEGQSLTWRSARFPERVEASWRPYRPELEASAEADVTLTPGEGQVRQILRFRFPRTPPEQVMLRVPAAVAARFRVVRGGSLSARESPGPNTRVIDLRAPGEAPAGRDVSLVLEYGFVRGEAPEADPALPVPLVQPLSAARGTTKVRVWTEPGAVPLPPGGAWSEQNVEEVGGQDRLPALVLLAPRLDAPLALPMAAPEGPAVTVVTERVLVRAAVNEGGAQSYRASYLLAGLASRNLDVELPGPAAGLALVVTLDGKQVAWAAVDETGQRAAGGRVARLRLAPQLVKRGSVLEIVYELPPGRAGTGLLQTLLTPPLLRGDSGRGPTRWLIRLPGGWVPIGPEAGPGQESAWVRRGWLFVPRPATTEADLERWFAGPGQSSAPAADEPAAPSLTCWRDSPGPLRLTYAPQQGWLLACSLAVLGLGLGIYGLARSGPGGRLPGWFLPALVAPGAALAVAALFWPTAVTAVAYGCEPGLAVLALCAPALLAQRRRHRGAFAAGYNRPRAASPSSPARAAARGGEPSTADAPRPNGSVSRGSAELPRLEAGSSGRVSRESLDQGSPGA